ncbi:MAG: hypothetical protein IPI41_03115 [Flavobacteriales bacterium]|nr:hypothetical protein [Flavobacteriales bacterium]
MLDSACGSGHILVYGFELLAGNYEEEGYAASEIPQLIIEHNLFGCEIDPRAAQLAGFALMMQARSYHKRFLRKAVKPNVLCFQDLKLTPEEVKDTCKRIGLKLSDELVHDFGNMRQASNFGASIIPHTPRDELGKAMAVVKEASHIRMLSQPGDCRSCAKCWSNWMPLARKYRCGGQPTVHGWWEHEHGAWRLPSSRTILLGRPIGWPVSWKQVLNSCTRKAFWV